MKLLELKENGVTTGIIAILDKYFMDKVNPYLSIMQNDEKERISGLLDSLKDAMVEMDNLDITEALHQAGWSEELKTYPLGAVKLDEIMKKWNKDSGYVKLSEIEIDEEYVHNLLIKLGVTFKSIETLGVIRFIVNNIQSLIKVKE